jgi:hypothetical protein
MAFIGTPLDTRNTFQSLVGKRFNGDGSTTAFTLDVAPSSTLDIEVFVGNVRQDPNSAYTLSGTTLTFTGAPPSGTNNIYVVHQAKSVGTINAPDNSVDSAQLNTAILTGATDIGANIADADLFLIDDGAGGTLRKTAASRIKTYVGGASTLNELTDVSVDITNFADGLLIQPNSDGSAPTTGTLSTATENIGIGHGTFSALTSGDYNTAVGSRAGTALTSGSENQLFGKGAGAAITTGQYNHIFGMNAGASFDTESHNVGFGLSALGGPIAGGEYNIGIGSEAGAKITSGDNNVMMGYQAGEDNTSGYDNVFVGYQAGKSMTTGYKNVCIGDSVDVTSDNQTSIAIGSDLSSSDNNQSNKFIFGKSGNIVRNEFSSNANWARNSDERIKKNIKDQKLGLDFINDLRTVTFQWKPSYEIPKNLPNYNEENKMDLDVVMHGFIAQEVEQVMIKHGDMDFAGWTKDEAKPGNEGQLQHISREMFVIPLVKAVQELSAEVKELKEKLENK